MGQGRTTGQRLIHRLHFEVLSITLEKGRCPQCGEDIPGIWWEGDRPISSISSTPRFLPPYNPSDDYPY